MRRLTYPCPRSATPSCFPLRSVRRLRNTGRPRATGTQLHRSRARLAIRPVEPAAMQLWQSASQPVPQERLERVVFGVKVVSIQRDHLEVVVAIDKGELRTAP